MAQYWEDWSGSTLNSAPTGWTPMFVTAGTLWKVEEDTSGYAPAGRRLLVDKSATDRAGLRFDAVGNGLADVKISMLARCTVRTAQITQYVGPCARMAGSAASETFVAGMFTGATPTIEGIGVRQGKAGTFSIIGDNAADVWTTTGYYWLTFETSGTSATITISDVATPETQIATLTKTVAVTAAGYVGLFASIAETVVHVLAVGVGTAGDPAPYANPTDVTAPTLTSASGSATGQTTASGSVSTNEATGTLYWLASANATETATTVKAGSSQAVTATGTQSVSITGLTASTSYYLHFVHRDAAGNDSTVATSAQFTTSAADSTPPTLTGPSATATGQTTASGSVSTNESTGTLYYLASANSTETAATVKAASFQSVSSTGTQSVSVSGLTAATSYYLHYLHRDAAGNDSSVSTSAQFITDAATVRGVELVLYNGASARAGLTGIRALWWNSTAPTGAPALETTTETTDGTGLLSINIESVTSLSVGQNGFLLLYQLNATDHRDSLVFAGQVAVSDIG